MKTTHFSSLLLASVAIGYASFAMANASPANSDGSSSSIQQVGDYNQAVVYQAGSTRAIGDVLQQGNGNVATITQSDDVTNDVANITQYGNQNKGTIVQSGGNNNVAYISQYGNQNAAGITQNGNFLHSYVSQYGNGNVANTQQTGYNDMINLAEMGNNNNITLVQQGNNDSFTGGGTSPYTVVGNGLTATIKQIGDNMVTNVSPAPGHAQ